MDPIESDDCFFWQQFETNRHHVDYYESSSMYANVENMTNRSQLNCENFPELRIRKGSDLAGQNPFHKTSISNAENDQRSPAKKNRK